MTNYAIVAPRHDSWDDRLEQGHPKEISPDQGGSRDCPTRLHPTLRHPCRCFYLLRLDAYLREKVLEEWHRDVKMPLSNYRLNEPARASRGGQGIVFYVHDDEHPSKKFALKFKDRHQRPGSMWSLEKRELTILTQVKHPFIVSLLHSYETDRGLFMGMEHLSGGTLWTLVNTRGILPEGSGVYYSAAMVDALCYLHEHNIIFRDLKSENVALDDKGRPRLIDFGLAKEIHTEGNHFAMTRYDFVSYLAPEIYRNPDKCGYKVDSWSIGFFITELLLGFGILRPIPWENGNKRISSHLAVDWRFELSLDDAEQVSEDCRSCLDLMLHRDPDLRPSMTEAKLLPFFRHIVWSSLSAARPPKDPYSGESLDYSPSSARLIQHIQLICAESASMLSSSDASPSDKCEDRKTPKEHAHGHHHHHYHAIPNAPTISSDNNLQYPGLGNQIQHPSLETMRRLSKSFAYMADPKLKKVISMTVGNL